MDVAEPVVIDDLDDFRRLEAGDGLRPLHVIDQNDLARLLFQGLTS